MFGRQAKLPVDLMYGSSPQEVMLPVGEYVESLWNTLQTAYAIARERLQVEHKDRKTSMMKRCMASLFRLVIWYGCIHQQFHEGDL